MNIRKPLLTAMGLMVVLGMLLVACAPATEAPEEAAPAEEEEAAPPEEEAPMEEEAPEEEAMPALEMKNPDTYVVITGAGEPETLDPAWTYETAGSAVENNIYESLVWFNRERTDLFVPGLASSWTVNEAGDTWVFNIREGVTFHEGGTLEAHDVAYSLQRAMLQDRIDGPHWMNFEALTGGYFTVEDFAASFADDPDTPFADLSEETLIEACEALKESIVADDAIGTVTYHLASPTPWFLAMLANSFTGAVLDMEWMVENGDWDGDCANWVQFHDPAAEDTILFDRANGTGPYKLDHWIPGEEIVLVANENYWRTEPMWEGGPSGVASIPRVVIQNIPEWGTRLAMFEAGDADYIYVPPAFRSQVADDAGLICYDGDELGMCEEGTGYYKMFRDLPRPVMTPAQFNWQINVEGGNPYTGSGVLDGNGIPPNFFGDEHVRLAFNWCFDFDAMIQDALGGDGIQAQGPIIAGMLGYRESEDPLYSYDPAKCEEEFRAAFGGELWETGFYMQTAYNMGNETRRIASEIMKAGVEAVNEDFHIEVVGMPWPVLLNNRRAQKLPVYVGGWLEDFHDPHNWVHPFLHSQGAYGRVINMPEDVAAEFDALIEQAATLTTAEERGPIYEEIQLKAQEVAPVIWLYQEVGRIHLQDWMHGYYFNPAYSGLAYSWIYALSKAQ